MTGHPYTEFKPIPRWFKTQAQWLKPIPQWLRISQVVHNKQC